MYTDKVPLLFLPRPFVSSNNKRRKPPRCRSASLADEPVTIVVTTVWSWSEHLFTCVRLYPDKVLSLFLPRPFITSTTREGSLRDIDLRIWAMSLSQLSYYDTLVKPASATCASPEVPEGVSLSPPTSPGPLGHTVGGFHPKRKGEVGDSGKTTK